MNYESELCLHFRFNVARLLCLKSRDFEIDCTLEHVAIEAAAMEIGIVPFLFLGLQFLELLTTCDIS
jgi:hypothetical protein